MGEYKSFYKEVKGGEGNRCNYPIRLDTYGCGCAHDCAYCYAKSLLDFRGLWNPKDPAVADVGKVRRKIARIAPGTVVRLGGMTDCFQKCEREHGVTKSAIEALNERGVGYLIVTKSDMVADDDYIGLLDPKLAHVQISVTSTSDGFNRLKEQAPAPSRRLAAATKLQDAGIDVSLRVSPYVPELVDVDVLNWSGIKKCLVEFLRVNHWIDKWMGGGFGDYTVKDGGYRHLPLEVKADLVDAFEFEEITVCEDVPDHYEYWRENVNANPDDCCNLRKG